MTKRNTTFSVAAFAAMATLAVNTNVHAQETALLPPELLERAQAGECYGKVSLPAKYETRSERVLAESESSRVVTTPAEYKMVSQRIQVSEPSARLQIIPAKYGTTTERVLVKAEGERLETIPAKYEMRSERILVSPAKKVWKRGDVGGAEARRVDADGGVLCLVEVPAQYKTVTRRVEIEPASTRSVKVPAEYKTITKRVVVEPAKAVEVAIPAEYKTVQVREVVKPAASQTIAIPAKYRTVSKRHLVKAAEVTWAPVVCNTNDRGDIITQVQQKLKSKGYAVNVDGVLGPDTLTATEQFQRANNLYQGQLTLETLKALGVSYSPVVGQSAQITTPAASNVISNVTTSLENEVAALISNVGAENRFGN